MLSVPRGLLASRESIITIQLNQSKYKYPAQKKHGLPKVGGPGVSFPPLLQRTTWPWNRKSRERRSRLS